ncbi:MAG: T9SS type A sorting domain-containing protein [Bacteroidetes bacterium]|jgi:hypothetical protein|nr:T9SS type A sorting domain-containing protein [Bacteroidota bacterium]
MKKTRKITQSYHLSMLNIRIVVIAVLCLYVLIPANAQIKIVPIGNSITQGSGGHDSYRENLATKLTDAGYNFDFVGSMSTNKDCGGFSFDPNHEGHWGWRTDEILNGPDTEYNCRGDSNLTYWLESYDPDVALVHLGTNDILQGQSHSSTINELKQVIDTLREDNPDIVVFLAQLIPSVNSGVNSSISTLNSMLQTGVVDVKNTAQSPVILVDQNTGFSTSEDLHDQYHPDDSGEEKMAQKWFDAIDNYFDGTPECIGFDVTINKDDITCNGNNDGEATAVISNGQAPYSYSWSTSSSTSQITNLSQGTYSVTVSDDNNCTDNASVTINEPGLLNASLDADDEYPVGAGNGRVDLTVTGGTNPYSYNWSNTETTEDIDNLEPNTYTVTLTDANGCIDSESAVVGSPDCSSFTVGINKTDISCYGETDGTASSDISNGVGPYDYSWSTTASSSQITGLSAGSYNLTVTDDRGCIDQASTTIIEPSELSISLTPTDESYVGQGDGSIDLTVSGGSPVYTYDWSNDEITEDIAGLSPAVYSVEVTDSRGCVENGSATVSSPDCSGFNVNVSKNDLQCYGLTNGSARANVSGGQSPFNYAWSDGGNTDEITGLNADNYAVTVTDNVGCTEIVNFSIMEPSQIIVTPSITNESVRGLNNGSIDLNVSGGTSPYSYNWSNGSSTQDLNNLAPNTYSVTVTDDNGCTFMDSYTVDPGDPDCADFNISMNKTDVLCNGDDNGTASAIVTGGESPYAYNWSNGANTQSITDLDGGSYTVTVTGTFGCEDIQTVTVNEPSLIAASSTISHESVRGLNDGEIDLSVSGGTSHYSYKWSNEETTQDLTNLEPATYSLTITDDNGCTYMDNYTVDPGAPDCSDFSLALTKTDITCFGNNNGSASAIVSGGELPYTYNWSNGETTADITGLEGGDYTVTVTGTFGCEDIQSVSINEPDPLNLSLIVTNESALGESDGSIDLTVSGGTPNYSYSWSNGASTENINNLSPATYAVTVTDDNGCVETQSATVNQGDLDCDDFTMTLNKTDISCFGHADGYITSVVSGAVEPYSYAWSTGAYTQQINNLDEGTYSLTVTGNLGCTQTKSISITEPDNINIATSITHESIRGENDGAIDISLIGGTPSYTYTWSNGEISQDINNLEPGQYSVTVSDLNACTSNALVTINPGDIDCSDFLLSLSKSNVTCAGALDGSVSANVSGGATPYQYNWSTGDSSPDINNIGAGIYSVTVSDLFGCVLNQSIEVDQPTAPEINFSTSHESVRGENDGSVEVIVNGDGAPYSYNWTNGETLQSVSNLEPGNYDLTITDINGCTFIDSVTINPGDPDCSDYSISINRTNISCFGKADGSATATAFGGEPPYAYQWSNGNLTNTANSLGPGTYSVTVTGKFGCVLTESISIIEPEELDITMDISNVSAVNANDGSIDLMIKGGRAPYQYAWSVGKDSEDLSNLQPGTYEVTVSDQHNCQKSVSATINIPTTVDYAFKKLQIDVYPNPVKNKLFIQLADSPINEFELDIIDMLGKHYPVNIKSQSVEDQLYVLDVANIPSGVYWIGISTEEKLYSVMFIKH